MEYALDVVAPPSIHPSGQKYIIEKKLPIAESPEIITKLYIEKNSSKKSAKKEVERKNGGVGFVKMPNDLVKEMAQ
jgi:hypothetical protein